MARFSRRVLGGAFVFACAGVASAQSPTLSVEVTARNGNPVDPPVSSIQATAGDILTVHVFARDWSIPANQVAKGYQVTFDADGFTSGSSGDVLPRDFDATTDLNNLCTGGGTDGIENPTNAFIDTGRSDFLFSGMGPFAAVNTLACDYSYTAVVFNGVLSMVGVKKSVATIILEVSGDAFGTFTVRLDPNVDRTFLSPSAGVVISPLALTPLMITVPEETELTIVSSIPASGSIDARQPSLLDGSNPAGWSSVVLTFNAAVPNDISPADFEVTVSPARGNAPVIQSVMPNGNSATVNFQGPIPPGSWTRLTHNDGTPSSICLGFLPGDVTLDRTAGPLDILRIVDCVNGVSVCMLNQGDADRSDEINAQDILRVIDLHNGAQAFEVWNGQELPPSPCEGGGL